MAVLQKLKTDPSSAMDTSYLLYILCINCYQRILVQRDDQYGFEQFEKFAGDGIRESFEKEYAARFHQLHGPNYRGPSDLVTLEGRFAPKKTSQKNLELIEAVLRGFLAYAEGKKPQFHDISELATSVGQFSRPELRLVANFIKQPWHHDSEAHFSSLRATLKQNRSLLFELLEQYPALRQIIIGIDAAKNELDTPQEVLSCVSLDAGATGEPGG